MEVERGLSRITEEFSPEANSRKSAFEKRIPKGEEREFALKKLLWSLGKRYEHCTLQNYTIYHELQRPIMQRLFDFVPEMPDLLSQSGGLLLFGHPGTGKDHVLAALLKLAVYGHGLSVEWFDGGSLFDLFHYAAKSEESDLKNLNDRLGKPQILAISDPQPPKGSLSDSQVRRIRDVIDRRYRAGLSTWITTNLDTRQHTESLLTTPLMQRLREGSRQFEFNWPPYRDRIKPVV